MLCSSFFFFVLFCFLWENLKTVMLGYTRGEFRLEILHCNIKRYKRRKGRLQTLSVSKKAVAHSLILFRAMLNSSSTAVFESKSWNLSMSTFSPLTLSFGRGVFNRKSDQSEKERRRRRRRRRRNLYISFRWKHPLVSCHISVLHWLCLLPTTGGTQWKKQYFFSC